MSVTPADLQTHGYLAAGFPEDHGRTLQQRAYR